MMVVVFALVLRLLDISAFMSHSQDKAMPEQIFIAKDADSLNLLKQNSKQRVAFAAGNGGQNKNDMKKLDFSSKAKFGETIYSDSEIQVLKTLSERRKELDKRSEDIEKREDVLRAAEVEVGKKISDMINLKKEIEALLDKQGGMQKERVNSLVKIYEGMKPAQAAKIFDSLDMDILLAVIGNMKERKSSAVLALMDAKRAREVTLKLAGEFKLPETPEEANK